MNKGMYSYLIGWHYLNGHQKASYCYSCSQLVMRKANAQPEQVTIMRLVCCTSWHHSLSCFHPTPSRCKEIKKKHIKPAYKHFNSFTFSFYRADAVCIAEKQHFFNCCVNQSDVSCDEASDLKTVQFTSRHRLQRHWKRTNGRVSRSITTQQNDNMEKNTFSNRSLPITEPATPSGL